MSSQRQNRIAAIVVVSLLALSACTTPPTAVSPTGVRIDLVINEIKKQII